MNSIEDRFDEKFPNYKDLDGSFESCYLGGGHCSTSAIKIKAFINSLFDELLSEVEGEKKDVVKAFEPGGRVGDIAVIEAIAFNQALEEVKAIIKGIQF